MRCAATIPVFLMALVYVLVTIVVMALNITELPDVIVQIFKGAFGLDSALFGVAGGLVAAVVTL